MHMSLQFLRLPHSDGLDLPQQHTTLAAGMDLPAAIEEDLVVQPMERVLVPTGFCIAIPEGYEGQVRPRSGLALKNGITVLNSPGTIDADYRGELKVILINMGQETFTITRGMRIAQLVIAPVSAVHSIQVDVLEDTARGDGGFGSTGVKSA